MIWLTHKKSDNFVQNTIVSANKKPKLPIAAMFLAR